MSLTLSTAVWRHSPARGTPLLVLLAIADATTEKGDGWCWLSMQALADRCRCSVRLVQLAVGKLMRAGALDVNHQLGPHGCNRFRVVEPAIGGRVVGPRQLSGAQKRARVKAAAPGVKQVSPGGGETGFTTFRQDQPGIIQGRKGFHPGGEIGFTGGVKPAAFRGETGFTQDGLLTSSLDGPLDEGESGRLPPSPPVGGVLRTDPACGSDSRTTALKDAQASSKATASRHIATSHHHPGD